MRWHWHSSQDNSTAQQQQQSNSSRAELDDKPRDRRSCCVARHQAISRVLTCLNRSINLALEHIETDAVGSWTIRSISPSQDHYPSTTSPARIPNSYHFETFDDLAPPRLPPNAGPHNCTWYSFQATTDMRARTAASPICSESGNDDNIHVASAHQMSIDSSDDEDDPLSDLQKLEHMPRGHATKSRTPLTKGKSPCRDVDQDVEMSDGDHANDYDDDDNVTEYSFKSEDYVRDDELEEEDFDEEEVRSHISLSDDEPEVPPVDQTPWRHMNREQRATYERMFGQTFQRPMNGSWSYTEVYQQMLDAKCLDYLKDFSCKDWVIPLHEAESTAEKAIERVRFRAFGIKIFGPQGSHNRAPQPQMAPYPHFQSPMPLPGHPLPAHQTLRSQPQMHSSSVPQNVNLGQPTRQPMNPAQHHYHPHGNAPVAVHPGQAMRTPPYPTPGQMPQQAFQPINPRNGAQGPAAKGPRKVKVTLAESTRRTSKPNEALSSAPPPLKAPTPPYPIRERPDPRKSVGKVGRGKTRRQAEADEFPWNRQLDFIQGRIDSKSKDTWDGSAYDPKMLEEMARTRVRNAPIVAQLEKLISEKQSKSSTLFRSRRIW